MRRPLTAFLCGAVFACAALLSHHQAACAAPARRVTRVLIKKHDHTMELRSADARGQEAIVASYKVAIGPGGPGPKRQEGDMTTPVGRYHITSHRPSQYRVFLGLDYPTAADHRRFEALKASGELPASATIGGSIGIHGPPVGLSEGVQASLKEHDWTAGCIAVDADEIVEVARLVRDGTVVDIEE